MQSQLVPRRPADRVALALLAALTAKLVWFSIWLEPGGAPVHVHVISATLASVLALAVPLVWMSPRARLVSALVLDALLTTMVLADQVFFRFYGDVLSVAEFPSWEQVRHAFPGVAARIGPRDGAWYADVVAALAACALWP
jgi:hypothetical protein